MNYITKKEDHMKKKCGHNLWTTPIWTNCIYTLLRPCLIDKFAVNAVKVVEIPSTKWTLVKKRLASQKYKFIIQF